ncbi:MAG: histidine kinase dimerization/phosphoacceptor domain -containing protein [Saprospiraceae bacterium]|nr:histidine kinase dimerization/phosphoacceptor domain -containing protein [Saprospiraceae bacterium]
MRSIIWLTQEREWEKSATYFSMCEEIARQSKDSNSIIEVLFIGGVRDLKKNKLESAKEKILEVIDYSERHSDIDNINRIHYHISSVYFQLKDYERSIFYTLRARDDTPRSSFRMHYNLTSRLTTIYRRIGMDDKIVREWKWYFDNHDILLPFLKSLTLGRITDEYIAQQKLDSALMFSDRALEIAVKDSLESMKYRALANHAHIHQLQEKYDRAIAIGKEPYAYFDESRKKKNPIAYRTIRKAIGSSYYALGDYTNAVQVLQEGLESSEMNSSVSDQKIFLEKLLEIAILRNDSVEAMTIKSKLGKVDKQLRNQFADKNILRIKTEYDIEKKDLQIQLLNSKNELKDIALGKSKRNIIFALVGIVLLGLISILLYNSLKAKRKSQQLLLEKNTQISKALADKELLLKEIHHRVKNNLQVVSSLLGLQSEYIKDESALSAINEGRNRVRSMSLIHQNLYKEHSLKGISMKSYLEKLISGLFETYNINEDKIKLSLTIQDLELDVDTVVPLGLITNELVSNALKHAFKIKKEGTVSVSLQEKGEVLELIVHDNGDGLSNQDIDEDIESFGYQMIFAFKEKLNAELDINGNHGTSIKLSILDYQKT